MKSLKGLLWLLGFATLAGCAAGPQAPSPLSNQPVSRMALLAPHAVRPDLKPSWMLPSAKQTSLLYVSNAGTSDVTVYTYLNGSGLLLVGTLSGFSVPAGMCSDTAGNVWVADYDKQTVEEFAHGGTTPIFTNRLRDAHPFDCSVDPSSGSLAVAAQKPNNKYYYDGLLLIYPKGSHRPAKSVFEDISYLAYDNIGDLFVNGAIYGYSYELFELSKGSNSLQGLTVSGGSAYGLGAIDWVKPIILVGFDDGGSSGTPGAYKMYVSQGTATVVGTLQFKGTQQTYAFGRRAGRVLVPDHLGNVVRIYNLSDGSLYKTLKTSVSLPFGAVVSQ